MQRVLRRYLSGILPYLLTKGCISISMVEHMKIVVFGGSGFIGSHVVDNLFAKGHTVTIFDRFYKKDLWDEYGWSKNPKIHLFLGDLKDRDSVIEAVNQTDRWMNLAGLLGTSEMVNNPIPAVDR